MERGMQRREFLRASAALTAGGSMGLGVASRADSGGAAAQPADLLLVNGRIATLAPELPPASPEWSPVRRFGGAAPIERDTGHFRVGHSDACSHGPQPIEGRAGLLGCSCFLV